ncbi:MAG: DUF1678 domain-containing protein [Pirellulales bacterium]|nr:DUF1678 domain-containing protein [Pirellulales bacterium]
MTPSSATLRPSPLQTIRSLQSVFARQGTIVASWRTYNGRKLGPYYRLAYRAEGRQRSIYLGKSKNLLRQVRRLLEKLQKPLQTRKILRHAQKTMQAAMKKHMAQFRIDLLRVGLQLRGYAVRGWRRWRALRASHVGCVKRTINIPSISTPNSHRPLHPPNNGFQPSELPKRHPG